MSPLDAMTPIARRGALRALVALIVAIVFPPVRRAFAGKRAGSPRTADRGTRVVPETRAVPRARSRRSA